MRVILTHEQADFDALASLLGAHLLDESALAVLPRRLNRNVRAYLTLYELELPFVDPRDLPGGKIEAVTLVDTQSLVSLKGMSKRTQVRVIDHHPPRADLPADWEVATEETGAATTLLVEALQAHNGALTVIQATLLLLGIYEDTGGLTYTRTTPRDARAAAYLLEQGASLQVAAEFLNHPLSEAQQALYDELRDGAETHIVQGHTIVVTQGDARQMEEELSTLAHKLRDLLDPDGLVLLITTAGGVQLIARATNDHVDVAGLAEHFGGGGHPRAAAALVQDRSLEELHAQLLEVLPQHVRPAVTVAEIMSRRPHLLSPDTSVKEAARRMQRYGYEGYPVVDGGKVVGLLTRRAVDRALGHRLDLTTADLMLAGTVVVHPENSVEDLQTVMTESGWGQVPVADPESGEIIGIVTRTDLLKTLTPQQRRPGQQNLAERLEAALPPARLLLLRAVAQAAHSRRVAFYIVGGFVRDLLLDRPSLDYDLVVEGDAIALAEDLVKQHGGRLTTHKRFGTAKWHLAKVRSALAEKLSSQAEGELSPQDLPKAIDLVSARREFYTHPTALPTVERGSIKLDLHRRDFTINTLALRLDGRHYGELHDYWGGLNDLHQGLIRVLHSLSFVDDPTRILRAVRFEQRFEFAIEPRTLDLLQTALPLLDRVSGDRLRHELDAIFQASKSAAMLARLSELGALGAIHPALYWDERLSALLEALPGEPPDPIWKVEPSALQGELPYLLWLMHLSPQEAAAAAERLRLSAALRDAVCDAAQLRLEIDTLATEAPSRITARLEDLAPLARYAVYLALPEGEARQALQRYVSQWREVRPVTSGDELRARKLPPGPAYKRILAALRAAWLDGEVSSLEEERTLLEQLIAAEGDD